MNPQHAFKSYNIRSQLNGWTRIDMLIAVYDKTILAVNAMANAATNESSNYSEHYLEVQKCLLTIHAGLKPDEDETAFNIARLLHYVAVQLADRKFTGALRILESIRSGFEAIRDEATQLESEGKIPALEVTQNFTTLA